MSSRLDMERLGEFVPSASAVVRDPELGLPVRLVEQHAWLAQRSDRALTELIVAAAVHLAMRKDILPSRVLEDAEKAVGGFTNWPAVRDKIAKIACPVSPEEDASGNGTDELSDVQRAGVQGEVPVGTDADPEPAPC